MCCHLNGPFVIRDAPYVMFTLYAGPHTCIIVVVEAEKGSSIRHAIDVNRELFLVVVEEPVDAPARPHHYPLVSPLAHVLQDVDADCSIGRTKKPRPESCQVHDHLLVADYFSLQRCKITQLLMWGAGVRDELTHRQRLMHLSARGTGLEHDCQGNRAGT